MLTLLRIRAALKQLPPRQREFLHLHYSERLSTSQIAERLDITARYVEKSILQSTNRLRDIYSRRYADAES
jgi:RNA polymerase sigma factor (sigma-70 family)